MRIDVTISAAEAASIFLQEKTAVVIDVLRATSVITTALAHGARALYPTVLVEEAQAKAAELHQEHPDAQVLLGGERHALRIPGFDLGNSPLEYTPAAVAAAHIVMTTSNGTRALHEAQRAATVFIGCLLNAAAVAAAIRLSDEVVFICSGTADRLDISDCLAAGAIISQLRVAGLNLQLSDLAMVCEEYFQPQNYRKRIRASLHGQRLLELGLVADLDYCCQLNTLDIVPQYDGQRIVLPC